MDPSFISKLTIERVILNYGMETSCEFEIDSILLPGFSYLGPGNPINNGQPVNTVDEIAREHDIRYYETQKNFELHKNKHQAFRDIQQADKIFIEQLKDLDTSTWCETFGKFVGYTIIKIKIRVEKCLNFTLYPRFKN